ILESRPTGALAAAGGDERTEFRRIGVREQRAIVLRERDTVLAGHRVDAVARGCVADEDRALVADDLEANVVSPGARPRDVQRRDTTSAEPNGDGRVVEIPARPEPRVDRRPAG